MSKCQINLIKSYLTPKDIMLEYGAGGSTLYFSKYVKQYISIEHDINWINQLKTHNLNNNIQLHYCAPNNRIKLPIWQGNRDDFKDYINYVDALSYKHYDKVLIDGRARQYCAKSILNYIDNKSIVFIHDFFERERYHIVYDYYNLINKDNRTTPSLAVFKKK